MSKFTWAEDDFSLPHGVERHLDSSAPTSGRTYVMYHGTSVESAKSILDQGFRPSKEGMLGPGVYLSRDLEKASRYPLNLPESQRVVFKVKVNVGKVIAINYQEHPKRYSWPDDGYDTAWVPPDCGMVESGLEENCIWDPKRITILKAIPPQISTQRFTWAEDDFSLPHGVERRHDSSAPTSGRTYVMYHGTSAESAKAILDQGFRPSKEGMLGPGVYLSRDLDKARRYPLNLEESQRVVFRVKVNVGKVIAINYQGHPKQYTWHQHGYDTAWVPPDCGMVESGLEENCIWDPKRITILNTISPKTSTQRFTWAEDDISLPHGVERRLDSSAPTSGRTYVMYHGTSAKSAKSILDQGFRPSEDGMLGPGVYLSRDLEKAIHYALDPKESQPGVVFKVKVNVGKVIAINYQGHPKQYTWHQHGYDTAWVPPDCGMVESGLEENCVWDPKRITILSTISPQTSTQRDTNTNRFTWAEDDISLPHGVERRLDSSAPTSDRTYVMYHGTNWKKAESILAQGFLPTKGGVLGPGVYLSRDLETAIRCMPLNLPESRRVFFKVKVNVGKVITINKKRHKKRFTSHQHGYDTAWVPPSCDMVKSGLEQNCIWDPKRITILSTISPRFTWAEDDFSLPHGVERLDSSAPTSDRTYVMYHGTTRKRLESILAQGFSPHKGGVLGPGVYLSRDLEEAIRSMPLTPRRSVFFKVKVNVGKVITIDKKRHDKRYTWHQHGYDTAWVPPGCGMVKSGWEGNCIWDPKRITILETISPQMSGTQEQAYSY